MKITRGFNPADRYLYDFGQCSLKNGFAQVDTSQDASYFGTWANPYRFMTVCYCEGDVTISECDNGQEFAEELRKLKAWNEEYGHRFFGIDCGMDKQMKKAFLALGLADLLH